MAMKFEAFPPEGVCYYMKSQLPSIDEAVLAKMTEHKVDREVLLSLTDEYLREIAPFLGDRLKLKRIVNSLLVTTSTVSLTVVHSR